MSRVSGKESFSPEEVRALDAWPTLEPPPDFAAQTMAKMTTGQSRKPRFLTSLAVAAALVFGCLGVLRYAMIQRVSKGSAKVAQRTTLELGRRVVAVAEGGSDLHWSITGSSAEVNQRAGNVFFRVDPGGPFVVQTPAGQIEVMGTCFRVEVMNMRSAQAGWLGAAGGAAVATAVLVTVYEGKVLTATPQAKMAVSAGEIARLEEGSAPRKVGGVTGTANGLAIAGEESSASNAMEERNQQLAREATRLRDEVAVLRGKLDEKPNGHQVKMLNLSKEELLEMARECELRWDMPNLNPGGGIPPEATSNLGLTDDEAEAMNRIFDENGRRVLEEVKKLYVEVTGDSKVAETLTAQSLIAELQHKAPVADRQQAFQKLARERAGLQPPPVDWSTASPTERLLRLLTSNGDRVEREIGEQIGPDLARRYRELNDGFSSHWRGRAGCPK